MENAEVIRALRCGGHNMMFTYCSKIDCPFCQFSYYEKLHKCNVQELGAKAADAFEAAEKRIAIVEEERDLERFAAKNYLDKIDELKARLPKEGEWRGGQYDFYCSQCGVYQNYYTGKTNYCPNCGARMRGANDE